MNPTAHNSVTLDDFFDVNRHIESVDLSAIKPQAKAEAAATFDPTVICKAYNVIKPILELILKLPFVPEKWKQAIQVFMSVLNPICG